MLGLSRSGVYRQRAANDDDDLALMRRIDKLFLQHPFLGSRRMAQMLSAPTGAGEPQAGAAADAPDGDRGAWAEAKNTSKPAPGHKIFPYLLRDLTIDRANQVWAADITYIPIGRGFLYLVAVIDWASRAVLAWRLSNTMDARFCIDALEEALARFGTPEIFNTDQGCAVHLDCLHRQACGRRHPNLDGRAWALDGQRVHRTAVALAQVRGHLSEGLRRWPRGQSRDRELDQFLQRPASSPSVGQPHADGGLARRRDRRPWRQGCGHDASPWASLDNADALPTCPQHTTATDRSCRVMGQRIGDGSASN